MSLFRIDRIQSTEAARALSVFATEDQRENMVAFIHDPRVVAIGAWDGTVPVGLALGIIESLNTAEVVSLFVAPTHRRQGVAEGLLRLLETEIGGEGVETLLMGVEGQVDLSSVHGLLMKRQWDPDPKKIYALQGLSAQGLDVENAPWLGRKGSDPRLELFPWHLVRAKEQRELAEVAQSPDCWYPQPLSPLGDNTHLHQPTSLGMRFEGELVGWSLSHRIGKGPIVLSVMFAKRIPEYPLAGLRLVQEVTRNILEFSKQEPVQVAFSIMGDNKFFGFISRQVVRYVTAEIVESNVYKKELNPRRPIIASFQTASTFAQASSALAIHS